MLRVFAGVLAIALMFGTTASQADAAAPGSIATINVYGYGGSGLSCSFQVTVSFAKLHQAGWSMYTVLLTADGDHYTGSTRDSLDKGTASKTVAMTNVTVASGAQYYVAVYMQKLVKGDYATKDFEFAGVFTQAAACAGSGLLAHYP